MTFKSICRGVNETFALLGCYAVQLPTFREQTIGPHLQGSHTPRKMFSFFQHRTDRLSRNAGMCHSALMEFSHLFSLRHHRIRTHQFFPSHWNTRRQLGFYFIQGWRQWLRRFISHLNKKDVVSNALGQPRERSEQVADCTFWSSNPKRGKNFITSPRGPDRTTDPFGLQFKRRRDSIRWQSVREVRLITYSHLE